MYLIDQTYFTRKYEIPNLDEMDSKIATSLNSCIDQYVRQFLQNALGYNLWKDLDSFIVDGALIPSAPQKWKDLLNGKEYTINGKTYFWKGLIYNEGVFLGSLLTPYVYYHFLTESISVLTGTGEKISDASNATNVNSTQRLTQTWNDFVNQYSGNYNSTPIAYFYRGVEVKDWYGGSSDRVGFVQFITDNSSDYPNATLSRVDIKNQLGL